MAMSVRLRRAFIGILLSLAIASLTLASGMAVDCEFVRGFKTLRDLIGHEIVGECLENERYNENGDSVQATTGGLLVWRKADNHTAFTDGYRTWINGPNGLQKRLNTERFPWEPDYAPGGGIATPTPTPQPIAPQATPTTEASPAPLPTVISGSSQGGDEPVVALTPTPTSVPATPRASTPEPTPVPVPAPQRSQSTPTPAPTPTPTPIPTPTPTPMATPIPTPTGDLIFERLTRGEWAVLRYKAGYITREELRALLESYDELELMPPE
ncbi:MAG: hypothetical protein OXM03_10610 [Chloroflexota bacterium]|nr:hypothetical protein [Chloroflexota bacterium]MDE2841067.1 hypothetical protein [Chloroflexota bacterium]MDE2932206.1 hypothetical protein [Chloroflexota bacterium]